MRGTGGLVDQVIPVMPLQGSPVGARRAAASPLCFGPADSNRCARKRADFLRNLCTRHGFWFELKHDSFAVRVSAADQRRGGRRGRPVASSGCPKYSSIHSRAQTLAKKAPAPKGTSKAREGRDVLSTWPRRSDRRERLPRAMWKGCRFSPGTTIRRCRVACLV